MALFKVVLCTWGKIVGEAVGPRFRVRHRVARTQGAAFQSVLFPAYELPIADRDGQQVSRRSGVVPAALLREAGHDFMIWVVGIHFKQYGRNDIR